MTITDHRAEAEREIRMAAGLEDEQDIRDSVLVTTAHALLAIHDLLDARLPKEEPEPLPEWEHALRLREERDAARDELARARTQIISLTGDLPGKDEVVVRRIEDDLTPDEWRRAADAAAWVFGGLDDPRSRTARLMHAYADALEARS